MKNNLFTFATSELSQDAFICWCLNWINYPNEILYPMAKDIFSNLLKEEKNLENKEIEIRKQYKKIDVLVILKNSKKAYIIEDKTNTFENNQVTFALIGWIENYEDVFEVKMAKVCIKQ